MPETARFDVDPALAPILGTVLDAVVVMTPDGVIAGWNRVAEATFGWSWEEVRGRSLGDVIVPPQHRKAHQEGLQRLGRGGEPHVINRRIEITALDKDGREMPIELSITRAPSSTGSVFVGFIRDISERRQAEAQIERQALESRLMFEIASMAAESDSYEAALRKALESICQITGWPVGHAFVVPPGNPNLLHSSGVWVESKNGVAAQLRAATNAITFTPGLGLPGRILQSGEPLWIADTQAENNFPRKGLGFRGAFGFPLKAEGRTVAILEFFSEAEAPPEPEILLTVRAIGEQVGRVFERMRTHDHRNLLLHELNHRVKNILSVVQAVAQQTFRRSKTVEEAAEALRGRFMAIAKAQDALVSQNAGGAPLSDIIKGALDGSGVPLDRVSLAGPDLEVSPGNAVTVSLAIHELCTNAFKYGSLSVEGGAVNIRWELGNNADGKPFFFEWREVGGPRVEQPDHKGFGTSLLERGLAAQLGGQISLDYDPAGVVCTFTAPLPGAP
jgi:PAS domain S-box-containing protein